MSLTITESGLVLTETVDGVTMPADYRFATVNDYVHGVDRYFEELQWLCLGMATEIEKLQASQHDEIDRMRKTISQMVSHCDDRAKGWDEPKGNGDLNCQHGARNEARAIAAQLREIAGLGEEHE